MLNKKMLITDFTIVFPPLFQIDAGQDETLPMEIQASEGKQSESTATETLPMEIQASEDKQSESTATTSMTAGDGVSITEENRIAEEHRKSPQAELFATESQNSELLFSEK
jgi:hypothetical protein